MPIPPLNHYYLDIKEQRSVFQIVPTKIMVYVYKHAPLNPKRLFNWGMPRCAPLNFYPVKFLRTISQGPKDSEADLTGVDNVPYCRINHCGDINA